MDPHIVPHVKICCYDKRLIGIQAGAAIDTRRAPIDREPGNLVTKAERGSWNRAEMAPRGTMRNSIQT